MYRLPEIYNKAEQIPLPTCMYTLPNVTSTTDFSNEQSQNTTDFSNENVNHVKLKEIEDKQKKILEQLHQLKDSVENVYNKVVVKSSINLPENVECSVRNEFRVPIHDVVIYASPDYPPLSLLLVKQLLAKETTVMVSKYTHSSIQKPLNPFIQKFMSEDELQSKKQLTRLENKLAISLIWKDVGADPVLIVNPLSQYPIIGELNILRYLFRLLRNHTYYNESDAIQATRIDSLLENIHLLILHGNSKQQYSLLQQLNDDFANQPFVAGGQWTIADVLLWSSLTFHQLAKSVPSNVQTWYKNCINIEYFKNAMEIVSVN
ncbi:Aminoacyl tRNA synthase complex-interacting multifunctional protein 2 [Nymphon striatum]|nr:Aminoacyl tRNA synthase complex-interacting multifunctional protein 2 [Nymphon striatum]